MLGQSHNTKTGHALTETSIENMKNLEMEVTHKNNIPEAIRSRVNSDNSYHHSIRVPYLLVPYNKENFKSHCDDTTMKTGTADPGKTSVSKQRHSVHVFD
jgi:hypothetical protein